MEIFRGFSFALPVYSVVLPQSGDTYDVRSMTVAEVNKLKTSLITPSKATATVDDMLWECLSSKPAHVTDKKKFKKSITTLDREALLYALYETTFGDDRDFSVGCGSCGHEQLVKITLSKIFSMNIYPGASSLKKSYEVAKILGEADIDPEIEKSMEKDRITQNVAISDYVETEEDRAKKLIMGIDINKEDDDDGMTMMGLPKSTPTEVKFVDENKSQSTDLDSPDGTVQNADYIITKRVVLELPISKIVCVLRQPTIADEEELLAELSFATKKQGDLVNETLIIEKFEQYKIGDKVPSMVVSRREDILMGYQSLPPRDKTKIFEVYKENFGQYGIELKTHYECAKCGFDNDLEINIASQFFRLVGIN